MYYKGLGEQKEKEIAFDICKLQKTDDLLPEYRVKPLKGYYLVQYLL